MRPWSGRQFDAGDPVMHARAVAVRSRGVAGDLIFWADQIDRMVTAQIDADPRKPDGEALRPATAAPDELIAAAQQLRAAARAALAHAGAWTMFAADLTEP